MQFKNYILENFLEVMPHQITRDKNLTEFGASSLEIEEIVLGMVYIYNLDLLPKEIQESTVFKRLLILFI